jgi:hypothetical protein
MKTGKKDLLKEAIADAKAVKETALANAKIALEEAFTPRLQSMLSHKLAEELEDDETLATEEDEMMGTDDEMMGTEEGYGEGYEGEEDETLATEEDEMGGEEDDTMTTEEEDEMMMGTMGGEEEDDDDAEAEMGDEEDTSDLDLESIIRELESEMGSEEDDTMTTEEEEENPEITELKRIRERIGRRLTELESSGVGAGDNKVADLTADTEYSEEGDFVAEEEEDDDTEVNLEEVIRALREMNGDVPAEDDEEETVAGMTEEEAEEMKSDLEEAYKVIKSLKNTINEVNLLNAKLLYTNKLFRNFDLNEKQKVKVVENFDRASSLREVKLVFATLGENLNVARKTQKRVVRESFASRPTKGTKPAGIITEGSSLAARFQKLANIKK